ncbi:hypothetical protein QKU58_gp030 [Pyramimonas orientalis virus]|uniref:Helicase ATP-binding domain-containing protein n=1 Tax=Pyramimonas orientalis virus 01B TaxID=3134525 RepID=A0A7M3UNN0_9VIRU|nr:hypothetical protein QKU58_gp030 [Pyramimonas orientalis virus]QOI90301.1 hypothetical protein HWQ62_00164 [Pyramimonas orientalis virus]
MVNSRVQELCDEEITNRSDFRKWSKHHHPDKVKNVDKNEKFVKFSNYVDDLLPTNNDKLKCVDISIPVSPVSPVSPVEQSQHEFNMENVNLSKAKCVRSAENWTKIMRHHRFDKPAFNGKLLLNEMKTMSPKMTELIENIRELDNSDFNNEGKRYKHFIFSDLKQGGYGAKIISSALVASGFNHCFTKSLNIVTPTPNERDETFGVLSSTAIYEKTFSQKHVKNVLRMYNERPTNVYGQNMRFIVLDSGFKEGVDLFDVKYVHIFENQRNSADLIQAVGRATRSCGQKGLNFLPNVGWKLHVYQYYLTYEDKYKTIFDDYLKFAGVNLNMLTVSENIEKLAIETAVDYDLNYNINKFESKVEQQMSELMLVSGGKNSNGYPKLVGCNDSDKCGKKSTKTVPFSINLFKRAYKGKLPKNFNTLLSKDKRLFFCKALQSNNVFCETVNRMYLYEKKHKVNKKTKPSNETVISQGKIVVFDENSERNERELQLLLKQHENRLDMKEDMKDMEDMTFDEFQKYINRVFREYKYKPLKIENMCEMRGDHRIVKFTESQNFVTRYFVPQHFAKGLLVWHSVGTGKTCTAISVKSFLYERMNYSVIWVTRSTLKEDIWKNMYDKICDHVIREKVKNNKTIVPSNLKKYLSKRFLPPMSYRQFSNMLEGKNELYNRLKAQNGEEDILKNTLIIVDEAHKLYSKDLVAMEKPNMDVVENKIAMSNTCKVLLMTGTPIADDPMEFLKIMNLVMKKDKFPTTFDEFKGEFLANNNYTSKGKKEFQKRTKGLISYLDRRFDPRQFTQPVFHKKPVRMSIAKGNDEQCIQNAENRYTNCLKTVVVPDDSTLNNYKNNKITMEQEIKQLQEELKNDKKNGNLKSLIALKKNNLKFIKTQIASEKKLFLKEEKEAKAMNRECVKDKKKEIKKCTLDTKINEAYYQNLVIQKCK